MKNLKVLIVDDVDSISIAMKMIITGFRPEEFQFTIFNAKSYEEGLNVFNQADEEGFPFDLVIMDLNLGGGSKTIFYHDGELLLKELKKSNPELKSIVYSQYDDTNTIQKVLVSTDADAYIVKGPQSMDDVKKAIVEIFLNRTYYFSPGIYLHEDKPTKLTDEHRMIINLLKKGHSINSISKILEDDPSFQGSSVRTLQRKIKTIRSILKIDKNADLIPSLYEMGIIRD